MRAVSRAWLRTVSGSHRPLARATVITEFQTGTAPTGDRIDILDGEVINDGDADIYGRLALTIPGALWPRSYGEQRLAPYGVELYIETGILYSDDLAEWLGLGYFRVKTLGQDRPENAGEIKLTGQDRMAKIIKAGLLAPRSYPASTTVSAFVNDLVLDVYPEAVIEYDENAGTRTLGRAVTAEDSRYAGLSSVAKSLGMRVYFDHRGVLVFRVVPTGGRPVARLSSGAGGTLIAMPREIDSEGVVNAVVATGNGTDDTGTVTGHAIDSDPASPTNYFDFGPAPVFLNTPLLTSVSECAIAAQAELYRRAGLPYNVGLLVAPQQHLQPDDLVLVDSPAVLETHVLSVVPHPLVATGTQQLQTRQQLITIVGS